MKRRLLVLAQLVLLAIVAWAVWHRLAPQLAGVSLRDFVRWRPAVGLLVVSTVGLTALHLIQAFLWRRIVVDLGAPPPDPRDTVRIYFLSGLARFLPGSVWQFAGVAVLGQQAGIPALIATAAFVIANLAFFAIGIVFLGFTLPGVPGAAELLTGLAAAVAAVAAGFVFTATPAGARGRAWLLRHSPPRLTPVVELAARIRPRHALAWALGYGVGWALLAVSFALFVDAFVPGSLAHLRSLGGIMAASWLGGVLVLVAPAGIGVREGIMAGLLSGFIPAPAAILIAIVHRIWFFVAEFLALASFPLWPARADQAAERGRGDDKLMEVL